MEEKEAEKKEVCCVRPAMGALTTIEHLRGDKTGVFFHAHTEIPTHTLHEAQGRGGFV